jgi:hypothetical protein
LRHKLSLTCLFVSSELLFNVLIDSSKYLSFVGLGIQSDLFLTNITKSVHEHECELHKEEIDYITNFTFTESYFYGLPKVHKSEVISNAILEQHTECIKIFNPDDLKFRPIVGEPN